MEDVPCSDVCNCAHRVEIRRTSVSYPRFCSSGAPPILPLTPRQRMSIWNFPRLQFLGQCKRLPNSRLPEINWLGCALSSAPYIIVRDTILRKGPPMFERCTMVSTGPSGTHASPPIVVSTMAPTHPPFQTECTLQNSTTRTRLSSKAPRMA